jgi:hypothetical protein
MVSQALIDLFPNIGLEKELFSSMPLSFFSNVTNILKDWEYNLQNRREFFEKYAKHNGFNPLVPDNWYSVNRKSIESTLVFLHL